MRPGVADGRLNKSRRGASSVATDGAALGPGGGGAGKGPAPTMYIGDWSQFKHVYPAFVTHGDKLEFTVILQYL